MVRAGSLHQADPAVPTVFTPEPMSTSDEVTTERARTVTVESPGINVTPTATTSAHFRWRFGAVPSALTILVP